MAIWISIALLKRKVKILACFLITIDRLDIHGELDAPHDSAVQVLLARLALLALLARLCVYVLLHVFPRAQENNVRQQYQHQSSLLDERRVLGYRTFYDIFYALVGPLSKIWVDCIFLGIDGCNEDR